MRKLRRKRTAASALLAAALSFLTGAGCAGESSAHRPCPTNAWVGTCELHDLRKVEDRELPMPYVVYEAIYTPHANAEYPLFTPIDVRMRFGAPARFEFDLQNHLKPQTLVACHAPAIPGSCVAGDLVADVVPFDPDRRAASEAPRIVGCAAIDAASEQDRLAKSQEGASAIDERFAFAQDSAEISASDMSAASLVAKQMKDDPSLECVGLVGQISPGESVSLGEARARAVKQVLVSLGVDGKRLLTISATASVYGPAAKTQAPAPESRRVSLRVLLKTKSDTVP